MLRMMFGKALPSEQFFYTCRSRVGSKRFQTSRGSRLTDVVSSRKRPVVPRADDWSFGFHRSLARCGEAFHSAPRKMFLGSTRKCLTGPRYPTFVTSEYGNSLWSLRAVARNSRGGTHAPNPLAKDAVYVSAAETRDGNLRQGHPIALLGVSSNIAAQFDLQCHALNVFFKFNFKETYPRKCCTYLGDLCIVQK